MTIDDDTKRVAKALAAQERYTPEGTFCFDGGFGVPWWVLFVSEARKLLQTNAVLKAK